MPRIAIAFADTEWLMINKALADWIRNNPKSSEALKDYARFINDVIANANIEALSMNIAPERLPVLIPIDPQKMEKMAKQATKDLEDLLNGELDRQKLN